MVSAKKLLLVLLLTAAVAGREAVAQLEEAWRVTIRPSALGREEGLAAAADGTGSVYVAGTARSSSPDAEASFVILKHGPDGRLLWARPIPLGSSARPAAVAVDPLGGAVVTGEWEDDSSNSRFATVRHDADGNESWRAVYEGLDAGPGAERSAGAVALALDAEGNTYVTGWSDAGPDLYLEFVTVKYSAGGEELWVRSHGGPGDDIPAAVAVDPAGRIHVAGTTAGPEDGRFTVVRYDASGADLGAAHHDEAGQDFARALAVNARGDAFIAGSTAGPRGVELLTAALRLDGGLAWSARHGGPDTQGAVAIGLDPGGESARVLGTVSTVLTGPDYRLVSYDSSGNELWDARFAADGDDVARGLAIDADGNAYVTGTSISAQGADVVTVKYDGAGNELWRTSSGGVGDQSVRAAALERAGGVYLAGSAAGTGGTDVAVFRVDAAGGEIWSARWELEGTGVPTDMALDGAQNVIVTGAAAAAGRYDTLTVKRAPGGEAIWEARTPGDDEGAQVSAGPAGGLVLAGRSGVVRLRADGSHVWTLEEPFAHVELDASGYVHAARSVSGPAASDFLTAKYGSEGDELWAVRYDASPRDLISSLALDPSSNVIVTGESGGAYATVKYDTEGNRLWDRSEPGGMPAAVAVGPRGEVAVTGPVTVLYDAAGNRLWASPAIQGSAAAMDRDGGVVVAGLAGGDFAAARFEPGGDVDWIAIRGEGERNGAGARVALGASGNVFVAGIVSDGAGGRLHAVVAYDREGNPAGEALIGPADPGAPPPVLAADPAGNAFLAAGSGGAYVIVKYSSAGAPPSFLRSETSGDGVLDIADPVVTLNYLFTGGPAPGCDDAADADDDGRLDITDAVFTLGFLFLGGEEPPAPGPFECGGDPSPDGLGPCSYAGCP